MPLFSSSWSTSGRVCASYRIFLGRWAFQIKEEEEAKIVLFSPFFWPLLVLPSISNFKHEIVWPGEMLKFAREKSSQNDTLLLKISGHKSLPLYFFVSGGKHECHYYVAVFPSYNRITSRLSFLLQLRVLRGVNGFMTFASKSFKYILSSTYVKCALKVWIIISY